MGSWDELCLLCGICPAGGPSALLHRNDLYDIAFQLAAEIRVDTLTHDDILSIVTDALSSSFSDDDRVLGYRPNWLPDGLGQRADLTQCTCIAIGYFDADREGEAPIRDDGRVPDGRNVEVRRVRDIVGGDFRVVVRAIVDEDDEQKDSEALEVLEPEDQEDSGDQEEWKEHEEDCESACSVSEVNHPNNPNFWLCERCYQLLNAWLDKDALPCRNPASHSTLEPMPLVGELYEIVNSRAQRRQDADTGLLPCIDYDGIDATLEQWQVYFAPGRRGSRYIAKGIRAGLRGPDLIPAIMRDFRCWMFMQPDLWPEPTGSYPTFAPFQGAHTDLPPIIATLPVELLILIMRELPVESLLSLASTCRLLRGFITDPAFINRVLREILLYGDIRWILPATPNEIPRAHEVASRWLSGPVTDASGQNVSSPCASPHFPYLAFVHACFQSDSMKNRKRIWGLVKQFEGLWMDYRVRGWEVDRFYPSSGLPRLEKTVE